MFDILNCVLIDWFPIVCQTLYTDTPQMPGPQTIYTHQVLIISKPLLVMLISERGKLIIDCYNVHLYCITHQVNTGHMWNVCALNLIERLKTRSLNMKKQFLSNMETWILDFKVVGLKLSECSNVNSVTV